MLIMQNRYIIIKITYLLTDFHEQDSIRQAVIEPT